MINKQLAIAIPTYNRSKILLENLNMILDDLRDSGVSVFISDDSVDNETQQAIEDFSHKYSYIFYFKNSPSLGHDANCVRTINLPKTEYIWYLGDSMIIQKGAIKEILSIIDKYGPNLIAFNADRENEFMDTGLFNSSQHLLSELAWHLTLTGVTVYRRVDIVNLDFDYRKFINFPQLAYILKILFSGDGSNLFWLNQKLVKSNIKKISYWSNNIFRVFIDDFKNLFKEFSINMSPELIDIIISKHTKKSGIFNYRSLAKLREQGVYNYSTYRIYHRDIAKYAKKNSFILLLISITPKFIFSYLKKVIRNK